MGGFRSVLFFLGLTNPDAVLGRICATVSCEPAISAQAAAVPAITAEGVSDPAITGTPGLDEC